MRKNPLGFLTRAIQKGGKRKASLMILLSAAIIVGGVFIYKNVFAVNPVAPATGGTNVSLDTSSAASGGGSFTTLGPLVLTETVRQ